MKRTLSLLLAFVMVLGLAACGGNAAQETTAAATAERGRVTAAGGDGHEAQGGEGHRHPLVDLHP